MPIIVSPDSHSTSDLMSVALVVAAAGKVRVDGLAPVLATTWAPSPGALLRGEAYVVDGAPAAAKKSRRRAGGRAGGVSTRLA